MNRGRTPTWRNSVTAQKGINEVNAAQSQRRAFPHQTGHG